jgi:hypothetical protein
MVHQARTGLCVDADTLAAVTVDVHGHQVVGPIGVVRFDNLTIQSHHLTPFDLAEGLRRIADTLDSKYERWLHEQRAVA